MVDDTVVEYHFVAKEDALLAHTKFGTLVPPLTLDYAVNDDNEFPARGEINEANHRHESETEKELLRDAT